MRFKLSRPNGHLPSNACSTMPSSKSPSVKSWYSAKALRTFSRRFSMRTPVCTRSTVNRLVPAIDCLHHIMRVPMYHGTIHPAIPELWQQTICVCCQAFDDELGY